MAQKIYNRFNGLDRNNTDKHKSASILRIENVKSPDKDFLDRHSKSKNVSQSKSVIKRITIQKTKKQSLKTGG